MSFDILRDKCGGWVVRRVGGDYDQHAHMATKKGCLRLIGYIRKRRLPVDEWMIGGCRRLLTEKEFASLKESKQKCVKRPARFVG